MKCFLLLCLKEIPRPFARTVELAVVKGFNFPLEGLGLGVRCKLIHHSNRVEMRLYSASPYSGLQWHRSSVLLGNLFFEVKLFRKRRVVLNKCICLSLKWNTEFLGERMKSLGAGGFPFAQAEPEQTLSSFMKTGCNIRNPSRSFQACVYVYRSDLTESKALVFRYTHYLTDP